MDKNKYNEINLKNVKITEGFWKRYVDLVYDVVIPYQWDALNDRIDDAEPSYSINNFRVAAGEIPGEVKGRVFQDSDVYKWVEAASYKLASFPDSDLEKTIDDVISLIGGAQQPDGYVNTHFTVIEPENRWTNERDKHELYCAGHLIEAAVAHYDATGKKNLLDIACRFADYIDTVFGSEDKKKHGYPGHQVIELALLKLYRATGNEKYLKLSKYFIDERGQSPNYFDIETELREKKNGEGSTKKEPYYPLIKDNYEYNQAHKPVREQDKAVGHAVRAMYMYTAMADLASETDDESLKKACETLWEDVTECQMYITNYSLIDFAAQNLNLGIGVFPKLTAGSKTFVLSGATCIFSATKHPEESWMLLKWLENPENSMDLQAGGLWMPILKKYYTDPALLNKWASPSKAHPDGYIDAMVNQVLNNGVASPALNVKNFKQMNDLVTPALDKVWLGEDTADNAMKSIEPKIQPLLQGYYNK